MVMRLPTIEELKNHKILVFLALILLTLTLILSGYFTYKTLTKTTPTKQATEQSIKYSPEIEGWRESCEGEGDITLTNSPMNLEDLATITPYGLLAGEHVTPIDHLYFYPDDRDTTPTAYPVYMMADGYIVEIGIRPYPGTKKEYRIIMQHSCTFFTYFDLILELDEEILAQFPGLKTDNYVRGHVAVKAGQEIGRIGGQSLDTAVYNLNEPLTGFITPENYNAEFWKIYTNDFFKHFDEPLRSELLEFNPRTVEPVSGKIDYDIPGKLVGNWFEEDTNGYQGVETQNTDYVQSGSRGYWSTHLAFVYDAIDPTILHISIGDFDGVAKQFDVKGNGPDFGDIGVEDGVVIYELIGNRPTNFPNSETDMNEENSPVLGTVLVQVLADERLRYEVFPGKVATEVSEFTDEVKVFER
jgi:hypothetical protein